VSGAATVAVRIASLAAWWWLMMAIHELGHVLACLVTGATIEAVILWPWTISQTVRSGSRWPLIDTWAGPLFGMLAPLALWLLVARRPAGGWIGGWAGFCLVANGAYLGGGWLAPGGDAVELMQMGVPVGVLIGVGALGMGGGLWLWHHLLEARRRRSVVWTDPI